MVLHGWKQIAQYLGCGIRTAQRWESQCGLPVTRPRNHLRSPVLAHSEGLDAWAGGASAATVDQWESRWKQLQYEVDILKRQVAVLSGTQPAPEVSTDGVERDTAHPAATRHSGLLAAKISSFDA